MKNGLEIVRDSPRKLADWGRIGLLCNQASVTKDFSAAWQIISDLVPDQLTCFFGPQHGFHSTVQDNMIESSHHIGPYNLPVYSLYSETREPTAEMLENVDTILVDIQIVGCRVYTFKYTIAACLRAAKKCGKQVVVLDRMNPLGSQMVEGRVLDPGATSFVGEFAIPLRHGLTVGEISRYFNEDIEADLDVIAMEGFQPESYWHESSYGWVLTSPNLPTLDSVYVYPATVMLEGTNLSEGRGTGLPFQFVGAPYLNAAKFVSRLKELYTEQRGVYFREVEFQPTSQKWQNKVCQGIQIHVLDPKRIETYRLGVSLIKAAMDVGGEGFKWQQPPYEYNYETLPINLILGHLSADQYCEKFETLAREPFWQQGVKSFIDDSQSSLLYERQRLLTWRP